MDRHNTNLTFYCELCDKPINTNICKLHGIDFVTIKKFNNAPGNQHPSDQSTKMPDQAPPPVVQNNSNDMKLAKPGDSAIGDDQNLPAIPDHQNEQQIEKQPILPKPNLLGEMGRFQFQQRESMQNPPIDSLDGNNNFQANQNPYDFDYADGVEDIEDYYQSGDVLEPSQPKETSGSSMWMIIGIALVVIAVAGYFFLGTAEEPALNPTSLYAEAETRLTENDIAGALESYRLFVQNFPRNPLAPIVQDKITMLEDKVAALPVQEVVTNPDVQDKLKLADDSIDKEQYIFPENDNALFYATEVLKTEPLNGKALEIKTRVIRFVEEEADAAIKAGQYNLALSYYQTMSEMMPNDLELLEKNSGCVGTEKPELKIWLKSKRIFVIFLVCKKWSYEYACKNPRF